jgi:magnesium transporter
MTSRFTRNISRKKGLAPGTIIHVGTEKSHKVAINIIDYDENNVEEKHAVPVEECRPYHEKKTVTWIDVDGIHNVNIIEKLGEYFDLHSLLLEDIANTNQRPKIVDFEDYLFLALKILRYDSKDRIILAEQISLVLGHNFVISFQENKGDLSDPIRERIKKGKGRVRKMGSDYLTYSLVDAVVDGYYAVLENLGEEMENLEEELIDKPTTETLHRIFELKKELIFLRKSVWPLREAVSFLEKSESDLIDHRTLPFLRDLYDHTIQVMDTIETFRDMIAGMLDIYLSSISNKMNQVMKMLTVIATIFIPLTFIVGIYGMNFDNMPELHWGWGYPTIMLFMFAVVIMMWIYFKVKDWI